MEGDDNNAHSLAERRTGVDVPLSPSAAARCCWLGTEGDNKDAHSFGKQRTGVDVSPPSSGNGATNRTTTTTRMMMYDSITYGSSGTRLSGGDGGG
jgi:hypothetical protein